MESLQKIGKVIARGRTAEVYTWSENQVLKLFYDGVSLRSVQKEHEITRLAHQAGVPVPQVFELIHHENRYGIVYERVIGPTMLQLLVTKPWQVRKLSRQLADLHFAIHQVPLEGMPSYREHWLSDIERVPNLSPEVKARLTAIVNQTPEVNQLCHFDFHPDQVVFTARGPLILDWMTACSADPSADIARTQILLTIGKPPDASWWMQMLANILGRVAHHYYQQRYLELNPSVTKEKIQTWLAPVAAVRILENIELEAPRLMKMINKLLSG
ncbi:MAG: aminoglycoside phosphotransferase family protein [Anaerolineaceae bacterium]|nr:aminoglycoside phosphotransferase family protein [Anaerolineaceae bacterium]